MEAGVKTGEIDEHVHWILSQ